MMGSEIRYILRRLSVLANIDNPDYLSRERITVLTESFKLSLLYTVRR